MTKDSIVWFAETAGFPVLEGPLGGPLRANAAAVDALGGEPHGGLSETLGQLVGDEGAADAPQEAARTISSLLERALVEGRASTDPVGKWRLLAKAPDAARIQVVALPVQNREPAHLEGRAAAADLAAGVSHDVANALSSIVGWAQLGRSDPERRGEALDNIERSARAARVSTERLLQAARPQRAAQEEPGIHDLAQFAEDVVRLLQPQAQDAGAQLVLRLDEEAYVIGTSNDMLTLVSNLVQNAIDASSPGGQITVSTHVSDDTVLLVCSDDGPGMESEQRERVFGAYYTTKTYGTGLGLKLVNEAVERLGGRIGLQTAPGWGTRFVIDLPHARPQPAEEPKSTAISGETPMRHASGVIPSANNLGVSVLVVEDDDALREMMVTTLEIRGAEVTAVANAAQALRCSGPYEVALVDIGLPDREGSSVLRELQQRGVAAAAALVSGVPPRDDREAGSPSWLRKPFDPADLIEHVRQLAAGEVEPGGVRERQAGQG